MKSLAEIHADRGRIAAWSEDYRKALGRYMNEGYRAMAGAVCPYPPESDEAFAWRLGVDKQEREW